MDKIDWNAQSPSLRHERYRHTQFNSSQFSFIPTPQETWCSVGIGNLSTCALQGFFTQLGFAVTGYSAMLSIYFLMTIQYGMDTETLAKKYEPFMHVFALAPPLMTAIIGVDKQMYFSETTNCWLGDICQSFDNRPNRNMFGSVIWVLLVSVCFLVISTATTIFSMLGI